ncbi:4-carboxymuconolactone decarboxylase [Parasphingorhabdus pacifica]
MNAGDADQDRHADGMTVRREVLGDAHVDRAVANTTEFTQPFQDFITRYAWGELWTGEAIDRPTRSCVTLAILAGAGLETEFAMHVRAALRNGVRPEEIREVLMHVAVYAGVPRANSAFGIANAILAEHEGTTQSSGNDAGPTG